jgi:hypothetical protein
MHHAPTTHHPPNSHSCINKHLLDTSSINGDRASQSGYIVNSSLSKTRQHINTYAHLFCCCCCCCVDGGAAYSQHECRQPPRSLLSKPQIPTRNRSDILPVLLPPPPMTHVIHAIFFRKLLVVPINPQKRRKQRI